MIFNGGGAMKHGLSYANRCAESMCIHGVWYMCVCVCGHVCMCYMICVGYMCMWFACICYVHVCSV